MDDAAFTLLLGAHEPFQTRVAASTAGKSGMLAAHKHTCTCES